MSCMFLITVNDLNALAGIKGFCLFPPFFNVASGKINIVMKRTLYLNREGIGIG